MYLFFQKANGTSKYRALVDRYGMLLILAIYITALEYFGKLWNIFQFLPNLSVAERNFGNINCSTEPMAMISSYV